MQRDLSKNRFGGDVVLELNVCYQNYYVAAMCVYICIQCIAFVDAHGLYVAAMCVYICIQSIAFVGAHGCYNYITRETT